MPDYKLALQNYKKPTNRQTGGYFDVIVSGHKKRAEWEQDERSICIVEHWALDCCGLASISSFSRDYSGWWYSKENTDYFVEWLVKQKLGDNWKPQEFLFLLADWQIREGGDMRFLAAHPLVRLVDKYENKAHGPSHCHLYRLSYLEDFKHHDCAKLPKSKATKKAAVVADPAAA